MAGKKKKGEEEELLPPEQYLPAGYSVDGEVYWTGERREIEHAETGALRSLRCGARGVLTAVTAITEEKTVEVVEARFEEELGPESYTLPLKFLSLQPPGLDELDELETGLVLPLRGKDVERIWSLGDDLEGQQRMLCEILQLEKAFPAPAQLEIVSDFHFFNLCQAKTVCLSGVQAAVFLAAMGRALDAMRQDYAGAGSGLCSRQQCFEEFQSLIIAHSTQDPPRSLSILKASDVRLLTSYAASTFFQHFLLYQYCVNYARDVQVLRVDVGLERPLPPPDLNRAKLHRRTTNDVLPPPQEAPTDDAADGGELGEAAAGEGGDGEGSQVDRLVAEKLRETERRLQQKLDEREEAFKKKMEAPKGK